MGVGARGEAVSPEEGTNAALTCAVWSLRERVCVYCVVRVCKICILNGEYNIHGVCVPAAYGIWST